MKNNLISAIAGWKSAALLALVAMVAAVAFSGVLSTNTDKADAAVPSDTLLHVGDIIEVSATATGRGDSVTFTLASTGLKGVFEHSRTTRLVCQADADVVAASGGTPAQPAIESDCDVGTTAADSVVTVRFIVGAGSTNAHSVVTTDFTATTTDANDDGSPDEATGLAFEPTAPVVHNHTHSVNGNAGQTVTVTFDLSVLGAHNADPEPAPEAAGVGGGNFYRISTSSIGSGTFVANGQTSIDCADSTTGTGCDTDKAEDRVGLRIAIADNSARGKIIVERYQRVRGGDPTFRDVIEVNVVSVAAPVATLTLKSAHQSIAAASGSTTLTITMAKGDGNPATGQSVTLITTRGNFGNNQQLQRVTTDANGVATATFRGAQVGGEATITATSGDLSKTLTITLHSGPDAIAVAVDDSTIQAAGASTFIVVTVTDSSGSAVGAEKPTASVKGPNDLATRVTTALNVAKNEGLPNEVPGCATGTNKDGQCVISVSAPRGATAGAHTVNVTLARLPKAALKAAQTVEVVGKPASLTIEAPDRVDPRGEADITISVYDEAGNVAASNEVTVRRIEGEGLIEPDKKTTKNGVAGFKFFAPTSGSVVISVSVGTGPNLVREFHTITVGVEPEPEPEPDPGPPATWNKELVSGPNNVVWNGEDGADPSAGAADGVTAIWAYNAGSGSWSGYFPNAADVPGGNTLSSLSNGEAYWVIVE